MATGQEKPAYGSLVDGGLTAAAVVEVARYGPPPAFGLGVGPADGSVTVTSAVVGGVVVAAAADVAAAVAAAAL